MSHDIWLLCRGVIITVSSTASSLVTDRKPRKNSTTIVKLTQRAFFPSLLPRINIQEKKKQQQLSFEFEPSTDIDIIMKSFFKRLRFDC